MKDKHEYSYAVGDIVTIKEWDNMVEEFGIHDDSIQVPFLFTQEMRKLCGNNIKIDKITYSRQHGCLKYCLSESYFSFNEEMFLVSVSEQEKRELVAKLRERGKFNEALI